MLQKLDADQHQPLLESIDDANALFKSIFIEDHQITT